MSEKDRKQGVERGSAQDQVSYGSNTGVDQLSCSSNTGVDQLSHGSNTGVDRLSRGSTTGVDRLSHGSNTDVDQVKQVSNAGQVLRFIKESLEDAGIEDGLAESWIILEWICGINRESFFLDSKAVVSAEDVKRVQHVLAERRRHVPLQYLMGSAAFMGYTFYVNEHVLIPRQDTECLVMRCLEILEEFSSSQIAQDSDLTVQMNATTIGLSSGQLPQVLDLCTGSGCIGISIKKSFPDARVALSDISEEALAVARKNAQANAVDVDICQGDLFEHLKGRYHMIVSNPPYIPSETIGELMPEVRDHEPGLALDGGRDGLDFYRRIVFEAKQHLELGGYLLFEIGMDQGEALKRILKSEGYSDIVIRKDLAGLDRIAEGRILYI